MTQRTPSQEWMRSARLAARIVRPGPQVSPAKAYDVVEGLRAAGHRAAELVPELAGLPAPTGLLSHVSVVDRRGWTITAAWSMDHLLGLSTAHAVEGKPDPTDVTSGVEVMATLTFLSQRILGQFDPFGPSLATSPPPADTSVADPQPANASAQATSSTPPGNLVLVAPNVLATQRAMAVDFDDFALWIALHEQTHALQFHHAPWLATYMKDKAGELINGFPTESSLFDWVRAVASVLRGGPSVFDHVLDTAQRNTLSSVLAVMSVLEGHADTVMDNVSHRDIPSARALRRRFDARRNALTRRQEIIGRLLGAHLKSDQYRVGARFVRHVISTAGPDTFHQIWRSPDHMPTTTELDEPDTWIARIAH